MARARDMVGYAATLVVGLAGGYLVGNKDTGHETGAEKAPCASLWKDFTVPGDPNADPNDQSTWKKGIQIMIDSDVMGTEQQVGFTDTSGTFHDSDPFDSQNGVVAMAVGHDALHVSVRVYDTPEGKRATGSMCNADLGNDVVITPTLVDTNSEAYINSTHPTGWRVEAR